MCIRDSNASVQQEDLSSIVKIQALYRGKMARASRRRARLLKSNALRDTLDLDSDDDDDEAQSARSTTYDSDSCLLYTSDAADEEDSVVLGGRRLLQTKKMISEEKWIGII
eukprot:TRINITY_DN40910_c0_g1_i1.p1 TRINITY_DN40910_c0_g1~~TRINITY_DN40910_c0_g1_i1.p1  ORF type:complete len:111 (+),score=14.03 TRINITY_DN40910_c0_g1_i1:37-369(+)